jgi:hypothetical protein
MQLLKDAWAGLSATGRVVLVVVVAVVLIAAMAFGVFAEALGWLG